MNRFGTLAYLLAIEEMELDLKKQMHNKYAFLGIGEKERFNRLMTEIKDMKRDMLKVFVNLNKYLKEWPKIRKRFLEMYQGYKNYETKPTIKLNPPGSIWG